MSARMKLLIWGILIFTEITFSLTANATLPDYRLPASIRPAHYAVEIITYLEPEFKFDGKVWIQIDCKESSKTITLHSNSLNITESDVTLKELEGDKAGAPIKIQNQSFDIKNDFYKLDLEQELSAGKRYIIYIPFSGNLTEGLSGYYRSSYVDKALNQTKWVAVTQFESIDARKAFPCFDEPEMKARFSIKMGHKKDLKSICNMPLKQTIPMEGKEGWVWDEYLESVPMSTYLVAFVVGDLEYKTSEPRPNNVTFRTWARRDAINQTTYAQEVGPKVLEYFEEYFDVKYPLPKSDMVALPDFSAGAMENWGLITYRETALLWDEQLSSKTRKTSVAYTVAHELAHQWFGNLVTMKWWSDLWLNEGFATHVGNLGAHHVHPEWNWLMTEAVTGTNTVFKLDSLNSSHPVLAEIDDQTKIGQIFDAISYQKGAALIRMMNNILSEGTFRKGVTKYLKKFQYSNAEQDDLWECLTVQAHEDKTLETSQNVKTIMDTWTRQTGYPLVTVTRDYEKGKASVSQARYTKGELKKKEWKECWWVPLSYTFQEGADFNKTQPKSWLNCENKSIQIDGMPPADQWVIFNLGLSGLYRVTYDEANWKLIANTLKSDSYLSISTGNRAQILIDSLELAANGDLNYDIAFDILKYLKKEKEYIPWMAGTDGLTYLNVMLRRTSDYSKFKSFMKNLLQPIYESSDALNSEPECLEETNLHKNIMDWSRRMEVGTVKEDSVKLFEAWMKEENPDEKNPILKDARGIVYCASVEVLGEKAWNFLWERYLKSNSGHDKATILSSLGCTLEVWLLKKYLGMSITNSSGIRKQDSSTVFASVLSHGTGFYVARDFLFNNIEEIYKYYGPRSGTPGRLLSVYAHNIANDEERNEFVNLIEKNKALMNYTEQSAMQAIERATNNAQWSNQHLKRVLTLLET